MKCSDWISNPLIIYCRDSNGSTSKDSWCLLKVYQIFLQKLKIGNTRSDVNRWDLPDEFILNGESLTSKTSITEKNENIKTVKFYRTHKEDLSEISQLSIQTLLIIYSKPTLHLSPMAPSVPTSHATTSQSIRQNKSTKWSPQKKHKEKNHKHQDENWHKIG